MTGHRRICLITQIAREMNGREVICLNRLLPENQGGSQHGGQPFVVGAWNPLAGQPYTIVSFPSPLESPGYQLCERFTRSIMVGDFYITPARPRYGPHGSLVRRQPSRFAAARDISFILVPHPPVTQSCYSSRRAGSSREKTLWVLRVRSAVELLTEE